MGQDAGPYGPVGPIGRKTCNRPTKACLIRVELDTVAVAGLINRCGLLSTSEVGLNIGRDAGSTCPLVPVGGTNRD